MYRIARYIVYTLLLALAFRQDVSIANNPLQEDGYYSLSVARNLALGNGCTVDGVLPTSGFQPLVTTLSSLCFFASGGDRILGLRFYLIFSLVVSAIAASMFARLIARLVPKDVTRRWLPAMELGYLTSLYVFTLHFNGLETGMLLLGYELLALHVLAMPTEPSRGWMTRLGVLLGLMILTRIDVLIPAAFLLAWLMLLRTSAKRVSVVFAAVPLVLIIMPWFGYVYRTFGTFMPSGGAAQTSIAFTTERIEQAFFNISETLFPFAFLRFHLLSTFWGELARTACFLMVLPVLLRATQDVGSGLQAHVRQALFSLGLGLCSMVGYYVLTNFATWHYTRYFAPVALIIFALGLIVLIGSSMHDLYKHLAFGAGFGLFVVVVGAMLLGKGAGNEMINDQVALVERHVPKSAIVASGQTGTLGFMRDLVLNIDGKVNHEALRRRNDIPRYLSDCHVHWFCDEPELVERFLGASWQQDGWRVIGQRGNFVLLHK